MQQCFPFKETFQKSLDMSIFGVFSLLKKIQATEMLKVVVV